MPKLLILNYHVELPLASTTPQRYPNQMERACMRAMWYSDEGDVVVSPVELDSQFLRHVADSLGFAADSLNVVVAGKKLYDDVLLTEEVMTAVAHHLAARPSWELMACNMTQGVAQLARVLGLVGPDELSFAEERGADLLNRKSHFRQIARPVGIPVPQGAVVRTPEELAREVSALVGVTGAVIVKQDNAAGGAGNVVLASEPDAPRPGASSTRPVPTGSAAVAALWAEMVEAQDHAVVVEVYHQASHAFYAEYLVGPTRRVEFLNEGELKRRLVVEDGSAHWTWEGLEIPTTLPAYTRACFLTLAGRLADRMADLGHVGHLNIDAIRTPDGRLYFNEVNARFGGGLVLHTIAARILGAGYADHHVITSVRDLPPADLSTVQSTLQAAGLDLHPMTGEGVVVVAADPCANVPTECLVLAGTRAGTRELEGRLRRAFVEA